MLWNQSKVPAEIIVVDSSDEVNISLQENNQIKYVRSAHKNQPYQRYLGYLASKQDWLLYLDDDMEPVDTDVINSISALPRAYHAVAFAIGFENLHEDSSLAALPKSTFTKGKGQLSRFVRWLTGYPVLESGKVGWNGVRGNQPRGGYTEWFSGGAFLAQRNVIFKDFNFGLFTIFEKKVGMGEDFIIAFSIAQKGKIWATEKSYFWHNDQKDSTYSVDVKSFNRRVIYSRLYLSLEKARLENRSALLAFIFYAYYSFWRFLGLIINAILKPSAMRWKSLNGFIYGFLKSFELLGMDSKQEESYWTTEAQQDLHE